MDENSFLEIVSVGLVDGCTGSKNVVDEDIPEERRPKVVVQSFVDGSTNVLCRFYSGGKCRAYGDENIERHLCPYSV